MTSKTFNMTAQGPKKMPGWFSWRHQTRDAHVLASATYRSRHGRDARKARADARAVVWATLTDAERVMVMAANKLAYDTRS